MKLLWKTIAVCAVLVVLIVAWRMVDRLPLPTLPALPAMPMKPPVALTTDVGPTIEKIVGLSSLTTLRTDIADAVVSELPGRTGKARAVLIVRGDVMLGVDLSSASFEQVDRDARRAVLRLPQPKVQSARLDHEHTKLVEVRETGLWAITPGGGDADAAVVNRAMRDAQRIVAGAGKDPELIQRCRVQTEQVLREFLKALGWTIETRWASG